MKLNLNLVEYCINCGGSGGTVSRLKEAVQCPTCKGYGRTLTPECSEGDFKEAVEIVLRQQGLIE